MRSDRRLPVAIVGGGFSGSILAAHLARHGIAGIVFEGGGRAGRGTAYSTEQPEHVLNVRASNMSAWPDRPDDFARAVESGGGDPDGFAERRQFGRYLSAILDDSVAAGMVEVRDAAIVGARVKGESWSVEPETGPMIEAAAIVLAIGNQEPEPPPFAPAGSGRFIADPWGDRARRAVADAADEGSDVLVIGTGLTMVDTVLSLDAAGHRGAILAISRRGLVPRSHSAAEPAAIAGDAVPHGDLRGLTRWLRGAGAELGWRSAIDGLRPHAQALWQSFSADQQRRFLRHARPWWDVHRHRIAPEVARRIHELVAEGRLTVIAGRVVTMVEKWNRMTVRYRRRGQDSASEARVAFAFNCTGPLGQIGRTRDPLLRRLLDAGLARPDELGIGLAVDRRSRIVGAPRAWALGPLTKGRFWEIIAVPDIRVQAAAVAEDIAKELAE